MRAIVQDRYGSVEVLRLDDVPVPEIAADEVLVEVAAAGLDRGALHLMRGVPYVMRFMGFGVRAPKVTIPGTNVAGAVVGVGDAVTHLRQGDMVYGTARGTFAEYTVAHGDQLAPLPEGLSLEEAAVLPYAGCVAVGAVVERAPATQGRSFLIVGASGAVGTMAIQIAKTLGAHVTAVCGPSSTDIVGPLGADQVIDYTEADFTAEAPPHDVVLDIGGNTPLTRLRRAVAPGGTLLIIGGEGGGRLLGGIHRQLAAKVLSPFVQQRLDAFIASEHRDVLAVLTDFVEARGVRPVMGRCYPLALVPEAVRELDSGRARGRIAVIP